MFSGLHVVFHRVQILGPSCPDSTGSCRFDVLERSVKVGFFMDAGACPRRVRTSESTPFQPSLARRHCCSWIVEICLNMFRPQRCAEWKHATITRLQHTQTELHLSDGRGGDIPQKNLFRQILVTHKSNGSQTFNGEYFHPGDKKYTFESTATLLTVFILWSKSHRWSFYIVPPEIIERIASYALVFKTVVFIL